MPRSLIPTSSIGRCCLASLPRLSPMSLSECAAPLRIGIAGQFTVRADPAVPGSQAEQHTFAFDETHATIKDQTEQGATSTVRVDNNAAAAASSSGAAPSAAASPPPKAVRVTANTLATVPSDIPRSCPTDPVLTQLVALIQQAQRESDRYLTAIMDKQKTLVPAAAAAANPNAAKQRKKKRRNDDEEGEDEGEDAGGDEQLYDAGEDDEKQNKKSRA